MTELLHLRRDGLHPPTPFLSTLQILQSSRTWWQGMMCHHVRSNMPSLNREGLCTFVYTVHKKVYANFSQVVTGILQSGPVTTWRIFNFFQSGYAELSGAEIAWLCVFLKISAYQVDIRLSTRKRTTSWLQKLSIRLRYFRTREYSRFSYISRHLSAITLTRFIRVELTFFSDFRIKLNLNLYGVGGI